MSVDLGDRRATRRATAWPTVVVTVLMVAACSSRPAATSDPPSTAGTTGAPTDPAAPTDPTAYQRAVDAAHGHGLQVWLEADLLARWKQGPARFEQALVELGRLSARPGVIGVKVADELGYHDGLDRDPDRMRGFLHDVRVGLARTAPGKLVLIDLVVPELGCAPGRTGRGPAACRTRVRKAQPALTLDQLDRTLGSGDVDVVDLSTSLLDGDAYRGWGLDREQAQERAWAEIRRRGWARQVRLQARKALAFPDPDYSGTPADAERDARLYVDIPLANGAAAVDIWTWRQPYEGKVVHLLDDRLRPNPLWDALARRRRQGAVLFTHFTPSQVALDTSTDLGVASQVFTDVFVAAGLG